MSSLEGRIAKLSPEKRALFTLKLKKKSIARDRNNFIVRRKDLAAYPVSFAQRRMWFLDQLAPGSPLNNIPAVLRIKGDLNIAALEKTLNFICQRHEVLRARFITEDGNPKQMIETDFKISLPVVDLRGVKSSDREIHAINEVTEEARQPFDLTAGPLIRAKLFQIEDAEFIIILTMHHIVSDGWSAGVLMKEIGIAYQSFADEKQPNLPELPIQYADFAHWQLNWLKEEKLEEQFNYWKEQLAGIPPSLNLPTDRPRSMKPVFEGGHFTFEFTEEQTTALRKICREYEVTMFMLQLAVFQTLLYRYSCQRDLCVGTPVANREQPEIQGLIGFFVNVLVMRAQFSPDIHFTELLGQVKQTSLGAYSHQDIPFENLIEEFQPDRNAGHNPIFQVLFNMQDASRTVLELPGLVLEQIDVGSGTVKFDLVLSVLEHEKKLTGVIGFKKDLFDESTIERMAGHFKNLISAIIKNPDRSIAELTIQAEDELQTQMVAWNDTQKLFPEIEKNCIHKLFEQQVEKTPDRTALILSAQTGDYSEQNRLSYRELNERANQVAHFLRKTGIGPESLVGLCVDRSLDMIVGLLGILKSGGAYVPIDPNYPKERVDFIINDCNIAGFITHEKYLKKISIEPSRTICLNRDCEQLARQEKTNPVVRQDGDNLAYMIYTSGSTGVPKGVMISHRSLINHALTMKEVSGLNARDKILQYISLSFDASGEEIYPALISGAALVIIPSPGEMSGSDLLHVCEKQEISILHLPVPVWHNWFDHLFRNSISLPEKLRMLLVGGEAPSVEKFLSLNTVAKHELDFFNVYGPTEATITSIFYRSGIFNKSVLRYDSIPIGGPICNALIYILDEQLNPAPIGVPGEIFIGGIGLARGYYNRPNKTAEKFLADPFSIEPGARLYRTGDMGRYSSDGKIVFTGRADFQVKVRGYRIELGEIEAAIQDYGMSEQAVVILKEISPGNKQLIAYIVKRHGEEIHEKELHSFLSKRLPDYMLPARMIFLEKIPLTRHGKVDRQALPAPDDILKETRKEFVAPGNKLEEFIAGLWREILGTEKISVHDDFFALGGNSILGATFVNRLQEELNEYVYLIAIFDASTIAAMADYIRENYPDSAAKILGISQNELQDKLARVKKINEKDVQQLRDLIVQLPPKKTEATEKKNRRAVFVLSAPRSGSTLLRVMLGGNPFLFAPPELQLLNYNTLEDQHRAFASERDAFWLDGAIRAVMEIKRCDADESRKIIDGFLKDKLSIKEFYAIMQEWLGERLFVDKTPNYSLDYNTLERAESDFEKVQFIHLIRHPYGVIPSFEKAKLHVFYPPFFKREHDYPVKTLAELIWVISHQNILQFLKSIPSERRFRIRYEDLVRHPRESMENICRFLSIDFHEDMLEPQKDKKQKMTDGLHPLAKMLGDVRFHEHKGIDSKNADRWKEKIDVDFLGDVTWALAESFGYQRARETTESKTGRLGAADKSKEPITVIVRDGDLPLSFGQQRFWFLNEMEPGSPAYNIPVAVRLGGALDIKAVEKCFNTIILRHEVLRSNIRTMDGKPVLVIAPKLELNMQVHDLSTLAEFEREKIAQHMATEESRKPFDLAGEPLIRAQLIKMKSDDHILLLTMHHVVSDGWSTGIFIHEFASLYRAFVNESEPNLPDMDVQYVDYAHWQRRWLSNGILESQLSYWKDQLAGCPPLLELPTDKPRPAEISYSGATKIFSFSGELSAAIKNLSREKGATDFMTLMAIFQTLLYRYSGQNDICVGTPVANRVRPEVEKLIGFFVNTVVIRTVFPEGLHFDRILENVKKTTLQAFANQDVPFEKLVDEIQPHRNMSHTPIFQVMFAYQNIPFEELKLPGLVIQPYQRENSAAKFDMTLSMRDDNGTISGALEYNTDLFESNTIERFLRHFQILAERVVEASPVKADMLPLLSPVEQHQMLVTWNDTEFEFPADTCIHQLFERQAAETPEAIAVTFGDSHLTYRELNHLANNLSAKLIAGGVAPGEIVGICLERSLEMIVGIMAILKAGGAYLPLDPAYPNDRITYILDDAKAKILITQRHVIEQFTIEGIESILLDEIWQEMSDGQCAKQDVPVEPDSVAYVIYTSGSTGKPKGVMIQHQSALNLMTSLSEKIYLNLGEQQKRISLNAPLPFDASVQQLVMLTQGHTLCIIPDDVRTDGAALLKFIQMQKIDVLDCVPSQLKLLVDAGLLETQGWKPKAILPGGEAIDEALWKNISASKDIQFYNMYGPTECTVDSTICHVNTHGESPSIGRPVFNAQLYVLDSHLQPVPIGVPGELFISGHGMAQGYLHRPDLTAEKFMPNPFRSETGARMYRTGDLVRCFPNGTLEFLARLDHQVKLRGFRMELGEIESVLVKHERLKDVVVHIREDDPGEKRLAAYYIPVDGAAPTIGELRDYLKQSLPEYMVPSTFIKMDAFPHTPNGKVDRKALPAPDNARPDLDGEFVEARTEKEADLTEIWKQILNVKQVGVHDNFFELGGDSILSIQVISKAKQKGIALTPKQLFQNPTIAELAAVSGTATMVQAEQGLVCGEVPLTPIQIRFFEKEMSQRHHWNQAILLEVKQPLKINVLEKAIRNLISHHDALRLRFRAENGEIVQFHAEMQDDVPFMHIDLSKTDEEDITEFIESTASKVQKSLNIESGPVAKVIYFSLSDEKAGRLLFVAHHLVIDGVSWRILMEDLYSAYSQLLDNQEVNLPEKTTSFKYWAHRIVDYAKSQSIENELGFWKKICHPDAQPLPLDFPEGKNTEDSAQQVLMSLNEMETTALIQDVPATYGTEMNDILLTALVRAFSRWLENDFLLLDLEGHGREDVFEDVDLSRTVGWFTSIYPVHLKVDRCCSVDQSIKTVKEQLRQIPQRGLGYGLLRYLNDKTEIQEQLLGLPHPEVSFNYLGRVDQVLSESLPFEFAEESVGESRNRDGIRDYLIDINGSIAGNVLKLSWTYSENMHNRNTILKLTRYFEEEIREIITHCKTVMTGEYTPSDFPDIELSQDELDEVIEEIHKN